MSFYQDMEYKNEEGAVIIKRTVYEAIGGGDHNVIGEQFIGKGGIMLETPMGKFPHEIEVPLDAETISDAFENFDKEMQDKFPKYAQEEVERIQGEFDEQKKQAASQIVTPDQLMEKPQFGV